MELRTKLFEEPNTQPAAVIDAARACQASIIVEGEGGQNNSPPPYYLYILKGI